VDDGPVLSPHEPTGPKVGSSWIAAETPEQRSIVGGPWMLDPNMKSTIYLRNGMETDSLATTPVLYLSNGKKIVLPTVNLAPTATATVSIGDALRKQGIAPYANLKGYVELDYLSPFDPLCATVTSVDTVHSVIFTYGFRPTAPATITQKARGLQPQSHDPVAQRVDGVWWKHSATVSGFVSLSNTTDQKILASLKVSGTDGSVLGTYPVSLSPRATNVLDLAELRAQSASAGGVELDYTAAPESILVSGGLEDIATGYSAAMAFRPNSSATAAATDAAPKTTTFTELGLMTGAPDPMMLFPAATEFTPFSVIRNISPNPVSVTPEVFWMDHSSAHRKATMALVIPAGGTAVVDTHSLLQQAGLGSYNGVLNLTLKIKSPATALLMASGSVDQTGTYVFQVLPHEARESMAKTISYWSTASGNDTMVTVWNPADEAQDFLYTLLYAGGSYTLPLHLEARASRLFNIASIIHDQAPDSQGRIIPTTVIEGSARIAGTHGDNERILVDVDAGIYNVRKGTCQYSCTSCSGAVSISVSSAFFNVGIQQQLQVMEQTDTGSTYAYYGTMNGWSSSNTSIASISSPSGKAAGVAAGSFTASTYANNFPVYNGNWCAYNVSCPASGYLSGNGPGTVTLSITKDKSLWFFGLGNTPPQQFTLGSTNATLTANNVNSGTFSWTITSGSSRLHFENGSSSITKTNVNTVGITAVGYSTALGDTVVNLTYTPSGEAQSSGSFSLSIDSPYKLLSTGPTSNRGVTGASCSNPPTGTNGYQSLVPYRAISFFGIQIANIGLNEVFSSQADDLIGATWAPFQAGSYTTPDGTFVDNLCAINQNGPVSLPPQNPLSTVKIDHTNQAWAIGSLSIGSGVLVQTDVTQRYQDHGLHVSIVSPVR
jgi:hypothetical protein